MARTEGNSMTVSFHIKDITYHSDATQVEAYRRAIEIREFSQKNGNSTGAGSVETFTWTTRVDGALEVETVKFDHKKGLISYSLTSS